MRIAYVINSVEGGGAAFPVPAVAGLMRDLGAEVEVFALTRRDGRAIAAIEGAGVKVTVRDGGEKDHLAALAWLGSLLRAWSPDIIWTSLTRATLLGQLVGAATGTQVVSWQHAAFLKPANRLLLRAQRDRSALWVADSHCVAELTRTRLGVPPERLAVWPLFAADRAAPQARPWRRGEPVRIGALGRLHRVKGYDVLLAAIARLKSDGMGDLAPFEVEVAGDGSERAALERQRAELGLHEVRLTGFSDRPRDFLARLHLYVQPSRSEGLCLAAHEAMQAGLPTLVSRVGEMPYSVLDGLTGLVVAPGDPEELAGALGRLLRRPADLATMGSAARERVLDRFGAEAFASAGAEVMARARAAGAATAERRPEAAPWASGRSASRRTG